MWLKAASCWATELDVQTRDSCMVASRVRDWLFRVSEQHWSSSCVAERRLGRAKRQHRTQQGLPNFVAVELLHNGNAGRVGDKGEG
jgi:hypothetical protein